MKNVLSKFGILGALLLILSFGGCIVSATFIIDEVFTLSLKDQFYFDQVDVTDDEDWEDHKDQIELVDAVGFELYYTSSESGSVTADVYVDDYSGPGANPSEVPTSATLIIDDFTITPGEGKMSYVESLKAIDNLDILKALAEQGQFDFYATSSGDLGSIVILDSIRVVITLTASE